MDKSSIIKEKGINGMTIKSNNNLKLIFLAILSVINIVTCMIILATAYYYLVLILIIPAIIIITITRKISSNNRKLKISIYIMNITCHSIFIVMLIGLIV